MKPRTLLGTALVTTVSAALAVGTQVPSYTADPTAGHPSRRPSRSTAGPIGRRRLGHGSTSASTARSSGPRRRRASSASRPPPGNAGTYYVAYERTHRGLPVVGGDFVLAVNDDGKVTGRTVAQERAIDLGSVQPARERRAAAQRPPAARSRQVTIGRPSRSSSSTRRARRAWPGRPWSPAARPASPRKLTVWTDARDRQGHRHLGPRGRGHRQRLLQRRGHHRHLRQRLVVLDDRHRPLGPAVRRPERRGLHRHRRRLGQRHRHQPGDRLRRRAVRDEQGVGHARGLARAAAASRATAPATRRGSA